MWEGRDGVREGNGKLDGLPEGRDWWGWESRDGGINRDFIVGIEEDDL